MSVRTDTVNLIVNVNGNQAQNQLNDLRKRAIDLTEGMKGLKKSTQEYKDKAAELKNVEAEMSALKKQIGLTALTQKELVAELNKLKALKGSVIPFSNEFRQLEKDIRAVENRLYEVRNGVQGFSAFMSKITASVKQFGVMIAGYFGLQFMVTQMKNAITEGAKLSDSLADIRRVTGLSKVEVDGLNKSLGEMNTRSSTSSLREIAVVAGKLGVEGKDNILSFTQALDKLVVGLGDELGDANEIAETLGKIVTVFDGKISGDNVTKLGNAFVSLANSGASSAGFIADFDQRLSGIAKTANISLGALSGLGAGLEELGGRVESSSTAVQKIVMNMAADLPTAAKVAGMNIKEFSNLFAKDATEAMIKFAEGFQKNNKSFPELVSAFGEADEKGARVIETLAKMGQSADYLRQRIDAGKKSIQETGDIEEAFALKNETFGAELDKMGKKLYAMLTSETVQNIGKRIIDIFNHFLTVLQELPAWVDRNALALKLLTAGIILNNLARVKSIALMIAEAVQWQYMLAAEAVGIARKKALTIVTAAYDLVVGLLTGNLYRAGIAMTTLNAVMKANVFGVVLTAISAVIIVVDLFAKKTKELSAAAQATINTNKALIDVQKRASEMYGDAIAAIQKEKRTLEDANATYKEKKKAIDRLIAINPDFVNTLKLSADGHVKGVEAIDKYIAALKRKAFAEAAETAMKDSYKKDIDSYIAAQEKLAAADEKSAKAKALYKDVGFTDNEIKNRRDAYLSTQDRLRINEKKGIVADFNQSKAKENTTRNVLDNIIRQQGDVSNVATPTLPGAPTTGATTITGGDDKDKDKKMNKLKADIAQFYKDLARLRRESDRSGMDADAAELQRVKDKYAELYERAKKLAIDVTAIDEAQANEMAATMEKQAKAKLKKDNADNYTEALQQNQDYHNEWRENEAKAYADGEISRAQYEKELTAIDLAEQEARWKIAKDYAGYVDKAKKDEVTEHRKYEHDKTQATIEDNEKRKKFQDDEKIAKAKTNVLGQVKGSSGELDAKKALLDAQFAIETENMDRTTEMYKEKEADKNEAVLELEREHTKAKIDEYAQYGQYVGSALESIMTLMNNKGERELQKEKKRNDEKKKSYKQQLENKLISEQQYNQLVEAADAELDKKTKQLQRDQAKREKALRMFNAVISVAQGVAASLAYGGPVGIAMAIATGIAGALQIAAIASAPLPELGKGDWLRTGDKHKDKSGGIPAMIERDEAVMSAAAMTDNDLLTVTGTTAQITSALNARKGGKAWKDGARVISMDAWKNDRPKMVNPELPAVMAGGYGNTTQQPTGGPDTEQPGLVQEALLKQLIAAQKENTEEIRTMKTKLHAVVSIKEYRQQEQLYDNAKKVSGLD